MRWVGETYLEAVAPTAGAAAGCSEFLNAWKDHLPEGWREEATFSQLTVGVFLYSSFLLYSNSEYRRINIDSLIQRLSALSVMKIGRD